MFCAPRIVFDGTESVGSRFHVFCARTHFRGYRGRRVPFLCFTLPDSFSAIPRASGPVLMFCGSGLVFVVTEGVDSRFHVLHALTRFRRYRWRRVPFSYFARPNSFPAVLRVSGPIFMFCVPVLVFGGTEGVGSCCHVLLSDSFSAVPRASGPVLMFRGSGQVFVGTEGVDSRFRVLQALTRFRRYRGCRVPFSFFARPESFLAVRRASGPVFMFCTH
jgi:hypothetical protein